MTKVPVYQIESDVPIPDEPGSVPLDELDQGDSIAFPLEQRPTVQSRASKLKSQTGKEFTIRKLDEDTARVWRVK